MFTTPPRTLTTVQMRPPSKPPLVHVCGGVLYCTMTLTVCDGFARSGSRSGEIFELSANTDPATNNKTSHTVAHRARYLLCFTMNVGIRLILSVSVSLQLGNRTPKITCSLSGSADRAGLVISIWR